MAVNVKRGKINAEKIAKSTVYVYLCRIKGVKDGFREEKDTVDTP